MLMLSVGLIFKGSSNNSSASNSDDNNTYTITGPINDSSGKLIKEINLEFSSDNEIVKTDNDGK